jgi:hypothetical protein
MSLKATATAFQAMTNIMTVMNTARPTGRLARNAVTVQLQHMHAAI